MGENLTPRDVGPFGSKAECERVRAWAVRLLIIRAEGELHVPNPKLDPAAAERLKEILISPCWNAGGGWWPW